MQVRIRLVVFSFLFLTLTLTAHAAELADSLFQYSTINGLLKGFYDGDLSFSDLSAHGDLGLGTFNHLDGEMVALDGRFYQVKMDGVAYPVKGEQNTPFAVVTQFDVDQNADLPSEVNYQGLQQNMDRLVTNRNHFYAFRIPGLFRKMMVRSVPTQLPPYRPLVEVVKKQAVFQYEDTEGTLIGFYTPDFMQGLNVPGYHFHFLNRNRTRGGHVLDLQTGFGKIEIDEISEIVMSLPRFPTFATLDLAQDQAKAIQQVEKK
ncbi:MAG: acetolactate decarboxylase [Desulfocapsaceae bacterium]|nr:acetolactate decarboxylase [Desulfocapsaceae bacterium]